MKGNGFTLIETLLYIGLFALLISGTTVSVYALSESSERNKTIALLEEEGTFLEEKIRWALSDTANVTSPLPASTSDTLSLIRASGKQVSIWQSDVHLYIKNGEGADKAEPLSADAITAGNLTLTRDALVEHTERISAFFTLTATTSAGIPLSRTFSIVEYVSPYSAR